MARGGLFGWIGGASLHGPVRALADRALERLEPGEEWLEAALAASKRGPLVFVLRNASVRDYLALDHLCRRHRLPPLGFVNEIPDLLRPPRTEPAPAALTHSLESDGSALLFLKSPPHRTAGRGRSEGDALLGALLDHQARHPEREIMLMPLVFIWTERAEKRRFSLSDSLFGPVDFPGELRQAAELLGRAGQCRLRAGDAASLRDFLARERDADRDAMVRRLTYALVSKVERERRVVVGPAHKAPDRVREEVLKSPKIQGLIAELAGPRPEDQAALRDKARDMLREMETVPDADAQRNMVLVAEQILSRVYTGIDVDEEGLDRLRTISQRGSVVLLPSHKSHVDYIILSYMLRQNGIQIPVIAAGDNLAFFPAGPVLRRGGAFFIRRSFRGDRLYAALVDAYMRRLLRDGWMLEFFLEGGRSRTGKLLPPMLGLLNMVVASALGVTGREIFFLPVAIGYERLMEEGAFARELSGEAKQKEDASALLQVTGVLLERWGRVNIQFGEAIELSAFAESLKVDRNRVTPAMRRRIVKNLAHRVMSEINRVTAVTPGHLVALVVLNHARAGTAYRDLVAHCRRLTQLLVEEGARATPSLVDATGRMRESGIRQALEIYLRGGLLEQHVPGDTLTKKAKRRAKLHPSTDVIFTAPSDKRIRLDIAKNHIIHRLVDRALVATVLLAAEEPLDREALASRVQSLSRLFKYEFMFRADASFDTIFDEVVDAMHRAGELALDPPRPGPGHDGLDGLGWLRFHAANVESFVEAYRVAARSLEVLDKGPVDPKDLLKGALRAGERMFLEGEITRPEAVSKPVLENAYATFVDAGYILRQDGKLGMSETFRYPGSARAIENRIAAFLPAASRA